MIAVAVAVIIGVVAVTCGIVADSNHPDSLAFLGVMVRTTAAQIFLAGAICTWALFASLWLLSAGIRRSRERGMELRALRAAAKGVDFEAGAYGPGSATGMMSHPNADQNANPNVGPNGHMNMVPNWDPAWHPNGGPHASWQSDFGMSATENFATGPITGDGWRDASASPDDEPFRDPMACNSWDSQPGWLDSHGLPTAPADWPLTHELPTAVDWPVSHGLPTAPADWPGLGPEPEVLGFPSSMPGTGFSPPTFVDLDPLRPAAFAGSPSSFDQFTSDSIPSAGGFLDSAHIASDSGEAVPPRSGAVGPALADGTSPAAGLDGVDPRRVRKPIGE